MPHNASNGGIAIANRMLAESNCHSMRKLAIGSADAIPLELITYTGLTHLSFNGPMDADDVMELIHRLPHLVSLRVDCLDLVDTQTDFTIPECSEHEPMTPLDTQIKSLGIYRIEQDELSELGTRVLKYLLLRIPTLKFVKTQFVPVEQIQAFIDAYVQWYPHLANIKLAR
ncbi:hypothetical protein H4R19_002052 [Coemansia spiralis]|nr:hypothetical protein H4R19_002052 [Coemansia spiralis]